jgi:hypothetical protein
MGQVIPLFQPEPRKAAETSGDGWVADNVARSDDPGDGIDIVAENVRRSDDYCDSDAAH